jgi:hypothetical protein
MPVSRAAVEDWPEDDIIGVPYACRDADLWMDMQSETHERIGTILREMYAEVLQQPLSPGLERIARRVEFGSETRPHAC